MGDGDRAASWPDLGIPAGSDEPREPRAEGPRPQGDQGRRGRDRIPPGRRMRLRPLESSWRSQLATVRQEVGRLAPTEGVSSQGEAPPHPAGVASLAAGVRLLIDTGASEAARGRCPCLSRT